jgi:hypothetical protein
MRADRPFLNLGQFVIGRATTASLYLEHPDNVSIASVGTTIPDLLKVAYEYGSGTALLRCELTSDALGYLPRDLQVNVWMSDDQKLQVPVIGVGIPPCIVVPAEIVVSRRQGSGTYVWIMAAEPDAGDEVRVIEWEIPPSLRCSRLPAIARKEIATPLLISCDQTANDAVCRFFITGAQGRPFEAALVVRVSD